MLAILPAAASAAAMVRVARPSSLDSSITPPRESLSCACSPSNASVSAPLVSTTTSDNAGPPGNAGGISARTVPFQRAAISALDAFLDLDHKMNTVSSIEQSATLIPGIKICWHPKHLELFAKFGAGGYYLEIDDDLPRENSDYRLEDLSNSEFALFQEYKAAFGLNHGLSFSFRYKDYRDTSWEQLESSEKIEMAYLADSGKRFVLEAEKTHYNLDQFSRSAGDNGLAVLPFDKDVFYQAYLELHF